MIHNLSKRLYDIVLSAVGLCCALPLLVMIAFLVKGFSEGPVFYRQRRIGQNGKLFWIWKFRTMVTNAERLGPSVTKDSDPRITSIGRILRKTKLDELPQLWNVLNGEMSFVGPRPEVPQYVEQYTSQQREVLKLKPGITDLATLLFRNEEDLLKSATDVERFYVEHCVPKKIALNLDYARKANLWEDTKIIFRTVFALPRSAETQKESTVIQPGNAIT